MKQFSAGKARWYVTIRAETKSEQAIAFEAGIYDMVQKKVIGRITVPAKDASDGEYHDYDLGVHRLTPSAYIYVAPMNNPDIVKALYVDRIFCIATK